LRELRLELAPATLLSGRCRPVTLKVGDYEHAPARSLFDVWKERAPDSERGRHVDLHARERLAAGVAEGPRRQAPTRVALRRVLGDLPRRRRPRETAVEAAGTAGAFVRV
jgi:hypothetical protein